MDVLSAALAGPPGDKLKLATLVQFGIGVFAPLWASDLTTAVAITGIVALVGVLAVVFSHVELLRLVSAGAMRSLTNFLALVLSPSSSQELLRFSLQLGQCEVCRCA